MGWDGTPTPEWRGNDTQGCLGHEADGVLSTCISIFPITLGTETPTPFSQIRKWGWCEVGEQEAGGRR